MMRYLAAFTAGAVVTALTLLITARLIIRRRREWSGP